MEEALGPHSDVVRPMYCMGHLLSLRVWLRALLFEGERTKRKFMTAVHVTAVLLFVVRLKKFDQRPNCLLNVFGHIVGVKLIKQNFRRFF